MVITTVSRGTKTRVGEQRLVEELSGKLERYFQDIVSVNWEFDLEGHERVARGKVHSKSGYYRAEGRDESLAGALYATVDVLLTQRRRRKDRNTSSKRRTKTAGRAALWPRLPSSPG